MASDKPQLEMLDLLYDDELDEETRAAARRDIEQSDDDREELGAYESMLTKIRDADVDPEVPGSVHDSIMASARKHASENASRQAQVTGRAPTGSKSSKDSLWSRMNSSGASQLVLAAAVVLVGGFIFLKLGTYEAPPERFQSANDSVDQEVTFGQAPHAPISEAAPAPATTEPSQDKLAQIPQAEELAENDQTTKQVDQGRAAKKSKVGKLAQLEKPAEAESPEPRSRPKRRRMRRRTRKSASRKKESANDQVELFQGANKSVANKSVANKPTAKKKQPSPAPRAAEKSSADTSNMRLDDSFGTPSSSSNSGVSDSADLGKGLGALADSSTGTGGAEAENKPVPTQEESSEQQEQTSSVNTMESNYRSGNFAGVVDEADRYLSRSSNDQADQARVLELKARALARQGKSSQADAAYAELQNKHPAYKSDQIRRERADLSDDRKSKAKQRRRAPAESKDRPNMDFEDTEAESQPSSIEAY
jgi:hypothetical protein